MAGLKAQSGSLEAVLLIVKNLDLRMMLKAGAAEDGREDERRVFVREFCT